MLCSVVSSLENAEKTGLGSKFLNDENEDHYVHATDMIRYNLSQ